MKKEVHYAGFWKRVAIQVMEQVVVMLAIAIIAGILFAVGGQIAATIGAGVSFLVIIIFNIYSYFSKGKTIGDYIMKTKLVDAKTKEKAGTGSLFGRFFSKLFISSGAIVLWPVMIYFTVIEGAEAANENPIMLGLSLLAWVWMIFSSGKAGWSNEKQALHDTMSGTRYVEEKQYSGGWTWFANLGPLIAIILLGVVSTIAVAQFSSYFEAAQQAKLKAVQAQQSQNFDQNLGAEFNLTPEQQEQIKKAFEVQVETQLGEGAFNLETEVSAEVE